MTLKPNHYYSCMLIKSINNGKRACIMNPKVKNTGASTAPSFFNMTRNKIFLNLPII